MEEEQKFKIVSDSFKGPFEKLLSLIEKRKIEISQVSLAAVTDDFIVYVQENIKDKKFDFKEISSFIQTATILLLIKSKSLIPAFILEKEEEKNIDDLEKKIKIYKIFLDISKNINDNIIFRDILYKKKINKKVDIEFRPSKNINFKDIITSLNDILEKSKKKEEVEKKKIKKEIALNDVISDISKRIKTFLKINFNELKIGNNPKEIAVSFLAILELFRQNKIALSQDKIFGDIVVELKDK